MQLGDGGVAVFDAMGGCAFPMPESAANMGFFTASLAMADPAGEFHHCVGAGRPALLALYTDGVEKAFPEKSLALALTQAWQGEDSAAFKQDFYAPGGLNEFCTCLMEGHLSFYRFVDEAWTTYFELGKCIHASQEEASRKS